MSVELHLLVLILLLLGMFIVGLFVGRAIGKRTTQDAEAAAQAGTDGTPQDLEPVTSADHESGQETVVPPKPRAAIVLNPTKDGADRLRGNTVAVCRQEGWAEPLFIETLEDDPGYEMTREALREGVDLVVAAGGDGTVRAVSQILAGTDTPMGIIPMGTGNLLARNLGIILDRPEWALRIALWGQDWKIDVAHAQIEPGGKDHAFMVMAGLGFDAEVMAGTDSDLKSRVGWLAYLEAGSRKLLGSPTKVRVKIDEEPPFSTKIRSVVGGNCGKLQGGVELLTGAVIDDGLMDVIVISPRNAVQWVGVGLSILTRRTRRGLHTDTYQCREIVIEAEEDIAVQLDGDAMGETNFLAMQIEHEALTVRVATDEQSRKIRQEGWPIPVR